MKYYTYSKLFRRDDDDDKELSYSGSLVCYLNLPI